MNLHREISRASRWLEGTAMLLIAISAILFQRSATTTWLEARTQGGHLLRLSPIGIQDWGPDTAQRPFAECRWWPKLGDATLCALAPDGETAMTRIRRTYPLTVVSLWTSVLALFLVALRIPRRAQWAALLVTAVVPVMSFSALWSLVSGARPAFAALAETRIAVSQPGFGGMLGASLLMAIALGLLISSRVLRRH